jgi:hypothetical protein
MNVIEIALDSGMHVTPNGSGSWDSRQQLEAFAAALIQQGRDESADRLIEL